MTLVAGMFIGMALGFGLGWVSKPRYSEAMSHRGQVAMVAVIALAAALVVGLAVGERGWPLVVICLLLPLVFVAPYAGGLVRSRMS